MPSSLNSFLTTREIAPRLWLLWRVSVAGFPLHTLVIDCVSLTLSLSPPVQCRQQANNSWAVVVLYDVVFARMDRPRKGGGVVVVVVVARGHSVREFKCVRAVVPYRDIALSSRNVTESACKRAFSGKHRARERWHVPSERTYDDDVVSPPKRTWPPPAVGSSQHDYFF